MVKIIDAAYEVEILIRVWRFAATKALWSNSIAWSNKWSRRLWWLRSHAKGKLWHQAVAKLTWFFPLYSSNLSFILYLSSFLFLVIYGSGDEAISKSPAACQTWINCCTCVVLTQVPLGWSAKSTKQPVRLVSAHWCCFKGLFGYNL